MIDTAFFAVAALATAAALIKAGSMFGKRRSPGQGLLFILLLTLAITCFALSDKIQYLEDQLYQDFGRVLANITTMIAAFAILALLLTLGLPTEQARPRIRRRFLALVVCVAGMIIGFAAASPLPETYGDFGGLYAIHPGLLVYIGLFIAYFGVALVELLVRACRYASLAKHRPSLRAGLLLMAIGAVLGLVYLGEKAWYVVTEATHLPPPFASSSQACSLLAPPECVFSITLPVGAVVLAAAGATFPVWGSALTAPFRYYTSHRTFRALEPLWQRMRAAFPQIALPNDSSGSRWDLAFRLYRRVIEIDDGRLLLRPYMSPAVTSSAKEAATAGGLRGDDLRAIVEAAEIAAALRAHDHDSLAPTQPPENADAGSGDVSREAAWLVKVARAYETSPLVRELAST
jgi:hypothetical protein